MQKCILTFVSALRAIVVADAVLVADGVEGVAWTAAQALSQCWAVARQAGLGAWLAHPVLHKVRGRTGRHALATGGRIAF